MTNPECCDLTTFKFVCEALKIMKGIWGAVSMVLRRWGLLSRRSETAFSIFRWVFQVYLHQWSLSHRRISPLQLRPSSVGVVTGWLWLSSQSSACGVGAAAEQLWEAGYLLLLFLLLIFLLLRLRAVCEATGQRNEGKDPHTFTHTHRDRITSDTCMLFYEV